MHKFPFSLFSVGGIVIGAFAVRLLIGISITDTERKAMLRGVDPVSKGKYSDVDANDWGPAFKGTDPEIESYDPDPATLYEWAYRDEYASLFNRSHERILENSSVSSFFQFNATAAFLQLQRLDDLEPSPYIP